MDAFGTTGISWLAELSADSESALAAEEEISARELGYVRNLLRVGRHRPMQTLAATSLVRAVLGDEANGLSRREKELVALVVSAENRCVACVVGHAAKLRELGIQPELVDVIAVNFRHARLSDRDSALAGFAVALTRAPFDVTEDALAPLRGVGLDDGDILELVYTIGYYNFSNRLMSGAGILPDLPMFSHCR